MTEEPKPPICPKCGHSVAEHEPVLQFKPPMCTHDVPELDDGEGVSWYPCLCELPGVA